MTLKFAEKVQLSRQREMDAYKKSIVEILENSKGLALACDNLVKLRALKTRCDKISQPRAGPGYNEQQKKYQKKRYQMLRQETCKKLNMKRKQIRDLDHTEYSEGTV